MPEQEPPVTGVQVQPALAEHPAALEKKSLAHDLLDDEIQLQPAVAHKVLGTEPHGWP